MKITKRGPRIPEATARNRHEASGWLLMGAGKVSGCTLALLALLTLASCGGSIGGDDSLAGGGIGGTGSISVGPISALGSIFVNGVKFDTTTAAVELNGASSDGSMLQVGMVVTVEGTINEDGRTGIAASVVYDDNLQGPISSIDPVAGSLTVLGQKIFTDRATVFNTQSPLSGLEGLILGDVIEVSGLPTADGSIQATRISHGAAGEVVQISGPISSLAGTTFRINDLTVDFSGVSQGLPISRMNGSGLQNGEVVDARGHLNSTGVLIATELRTMEFFPEGNRQMQLAGYIQTVTPDSFTMRAPMGTITVMVGPGTLFTGGTAADLRPGVKAGVTGSMSRGTISAQEVLLAE
jgi:hypothetical protein